MATSPKSAPSGDRTDDPVRERIVTAARAHFFQHGYRGVTMDDLAAEMAMSKKTLYVHFQSKRSLLEATIDQKFGDLECEMASVGSGISEDFGETLHRLLVCMRLHAQEVSPTFLRDLAKDDPQLIAQVKARRRELIGRTFGRILRAGQKSGSIRKDIGVDLLVEILMGIADSVASPENLAEKRMGPGEVLPAILAVFLEGIQVTKGR